MQRSETDISITRRRLLVLSSLVPLSRNQALFAEQQVPDLPAASSWRFFTPLEAEFVAVAADVLIPADEYSPSASDAGVAEYLDRQLDGPYGGGQYQYVRGPFHAGTPEQGYQLDMIPRQTYRVGIAAVTDFIRINYSGSSIAELALSEQMKIIEAMEAGGLDSAQAPVREFFRELHKGVIEGYFSDPIYGGNRDMAGWKLLGFPGVDTYYAEDIEMDGLRYTRAPTGLKQR